MLMTALANNNEYYVLYLSAFCQKIGRFVCKMRQLLVQIKKFKSGNQLKGANCVWG